MDETTLYAQYASKVSAETQYAVPRPLKRGRYLIRSQKGFTFLRSVDALLGVLLFAATRSRPVPSNPARILVCNWAHIGDVLLSLPTIEALRRLFPNAEIDLLIGRHSAAVVDGIGLYNRLHFVDHFMLRRPKVSFFTSIREYLRDQWMFLSAAREIKYDLAIDLYFHFPTAIPLLWRSGIPIRCGFDSAGFGRLLTHPIPWNFENEPVSKFGFKLISALWPDKTKWLPPPKPCYPGYPRSEADKVLPRFPYILVHTGAGGEWKEWPESHWHTLVGALLQRQLSIVLSGVGRREGDRAHRLASVATDGRCEVILDRSWSEFVALVAGAICLICLDSAAAHVAAAFSIPTVAIYPGTNEIRLWGPNNPRARVLTAPTGCAPCHRLGCDAMACVRNVLPEQVLEALKELGLDLDVETGLHQDNLS